MLKNNILPIQKHQCRNGACTQPFYVCDGVDHCGDNSDEMDENGNCPHCPTVLSFL